MTKDEALTLALEALEYHTAQTRPIHQTDEAITAIKEALAQPEQEPAIGDIRALKHRIHALEGEVIGYKQILYAQSEQEPVAWEQFHEYLVERYFCQRCGKRLAELTAIHTCTPPVVTGYEY